jgi:RNA polymerase sigma-70 factor (ECF subfamily)
MSSGFAPSSTSEPDLLAAARRGDEGAYRELVERHRGELHAHCYRMTASVHDAEDALQDALLRVWRGLSRFEGRSSLRSWLYKIATNACLDLIERRKRRVLPIDFGPPADPADGVGEPLVESVWIEPYPDVSLGIEDGYAAPDARYEQRESVELAFIAAVQHLPASQRAVLIMRDVLGFSAQEAAESLETTVASANSALQRARKTVDERLPEQSQQATLRALGDDDLSTLVEGYMDAMQRGDVDTVVSMLAEDAAWSMPPLATWFRGDEVRKFLQVGPLSGEWRWRHMPARVSGQPAVGAYTWDEREGCYLPFALDVMTLEGGRIKEITAFITRAMEGEDREFYARWPEKALDERRGSIFQSFGLPGRLTD